MSISPLLIAAAIIVVDTILMISYEFTCGLYFRFRKMDVPWVYKNFENHPYRSISAFSKTYFFAWLVLAAIKFLVIEFVLRGILL